MRWNNIFRMGIHTAAYRYMKRKSPLNVMLSVTNRCQSNCSYCMIPNRHQTELSLDQIFHLINQMVDEGTQRLGLWGGEPLLRDDIGEIISYAKAKGLFVTMDSNGYLVPQKINDLEKLDHLVLALDGSEDAHDANREKDSYKKVMEALNCTIGKVPIWTITVLTKNNIDQIDYILGKAKDMGFLTTFQVIHHNDILGKKVDDFLVPDEIYRKAIQKLLLEKERGAPIASSRRYLNYLLDWGSYSNPTSNIPRKGMKCLAGKLYCNIDTNGDVYPCSLLIEKMDALNFLDVGFKNAFDLIDEFSCKACNASCFTEYNYLFNLDIQAVTNWIITMKFYRNN